MSGECDVALGDWDDEYISMNFAALVLMFDNFYAFIMYFSMSVIALETVKATYHFKSRAYEMMDWKG